MGDCLCFHSGLPLHLSVGAIFSQLLKDIVQIIIPSILYLQFFFSLNSGSFPLTIKHTSCDKENSQNNSLDPTFFPGTLLTHPISLLPFMENSWKILFFCYSNRDPPTTSVSPRNLKEIQTHMFHSYLLNQKFYFSSISRIYNNIKIGAALVCSDDF